MHRRMGVVILGMFLTLASVESKSRKRIFRIPPDQVQANAKGIGLETYYGEIIRLRNIKGVKSQKDITRVLQQSEIHLKNGQSLSNQEIEYALIKQLTGGQGNKGNGSWNPGGRPPHNPE